MSVKQVAGQQRGCVAGARDGPVWRRPESRSLDELQVCKNVQNNQHKKSTIMTNKSMNMAFFPTLPKSAVVV